MANIQTFSVIPFSTRLAIIRTARGLHQVDVAKAIGVDQAIISRYERGMAPREQHVRAIEAAIGFEFYSDESEAAFRHLAGVKEPLKMAA